MDDVRIDKWLWAARMFKHRSEASRACVGGHVKVNGNAVKASRSVKVEDHVEVRTPGGLRILVVKGLAEKRGPAQEAQKLYEDHSPPPIVDPWAEVMRRARGAGRPTKRERREILRTRRGADGDFT